MVSDPKPKSIRNPKYLDWIKTQCCVVCHMYASDQVDIVPAHYGKHGVAIKASDHDALPLCVWCHDYEHRMGQITFWAGKRREEIVLAHRERYQGAVKL